MRELSLNEMDVVAGGFSIGSCSVGGSYSSTHDGHGGSSTSVSVHAGCGINAPDVGGSGKGNNGKSTSSNSSRNSRNNDRGGKNH